MTKPRLNRIARYAAVGACLVANALAADYTELQKAAIRHQADKVTALLAEGAPANAENHRRRTALHYAVLPGQSGSDYSLRMVNAMLAHGADPNLTDDQGIAPIDLAVSKGTQGVVTALLENGANPNRTARNGYSLLTTAMLRGRSAVAQILKDYGAVHGVSAEETALLEYLPQMLEFSSGLKDSYQLNGSNPESLPNIVQRQVSTVWPDMSKEEVERLVEQARELAESRKARCFACPAKRLETEQAK